MENLTINQDLLIELLKLSKPFESKENYSNAEHHANSKFVHSLAYLLYSKNENFDIDLFIDKIKNGSSAYEDEMKEMLLTIIKK